MKKENKSIYKMLKELNVICDFFYKKYGDVGQKKLVYYPSKNCYKLEVKYKNGLTEEVIVW